MPNTKSAIRRVRRVKKQTQVNRIRKSKYKNAVKQMELLIKNKEKDKAKKYFFLCRRSILTPNIRPRGNLGKKVVIMPWYFDCPEIAIVLMLRQYLFP